MNVKLSVAYQKTPFRYEIFCNGKRVKKGDEITLADENTFELLEKNVFLSKWWFF